MNLSARILVIGLAFAVLTTLAAPGKPKFNPDEALGFLETLTSIQDGKPDIYLLAKLFKARYAPGAGDDFVKTVETFVSSGLHAAGRRDLYVKSVRPECKNMDAGELERQVAHECGNCQGGKIEKQCERCGGRGRCRACEGRGSFMHKLEALRPIDVRWEQIKCGVCLGSGRCSSCNGQGRISLDCPNCKGRGHIYDTDEALKVYYVNALALIKGLCDIGDKTDMSDLLKRDFSKARENAEKKFPVLRQAREKEEAEVRAEQERKEKEEQENNMRSKFTFGKLCLGVQADRMKNLLPAAVISERGTTSSDTIKLRSIGKDAPKCGDAIITVSEQELDMEVAGARAMTMGFLTRETKTLYAIILLFEAEGMGDDKVRANAEKVSNALEQALSGKYGRPKKVDAGREWSNEELSVTLFTKYGNSLLGGSPGFTELSRYVCITYTTPDLLQQAQREEQPYRDKMDAQIQAAAEEIKRKEEQSLNSL